MNPYKNFIFKDEPTTSNEPPNEQNVEAESCSADGTIEAQRFRPPSHPRGRQPAPPPRPGVHPIPRPPVMPPGGHGHRPPPRPPVHPRPPVTPPGGHGHRPPPRPPIHPRPPITPPGGHGHRPPPMPRPPHPPGPPMPPHDFRPIPPPIGPEIDGHHLPPPPGIPPLKPAGSPLRIEGGAISGCMYNNTYIWLKNGKAFWFYPTFVGRNSIAGYRYSRHGWVYLGFDLDRIESFFCSR